jgi:radical SAM superfamily enzyme YgiQ (UPF0313 family)
LDRLEQIIRDGISFTLVRKVSLIGSSLGDMDRLHELAGWLLAQGLKMSISSLRADSVTEDLLRVLVSAGQRTLTVAPETGTERLRQQMGKGLSDQDIENAVCLASSAGFKSIKLYFIIGLPGENDSDVLGIAKMVKRFALQTRMKITASVNPFVPKAGTSFEREVQLSVEELRRRTRAIQRALKGVPRVEVESLDPRIARIQASLSIGHRGIGPVIKAASFYGGLGGWRRAERETGIPFHDIAEDDSGRSGVLPWSFLSD